MQYPWLEQIHQGFNASFEAGRFHHAHLIHGKKGTGKGELAQSLSNALLCQAPQQMKACGQCKSCLLLRAGTHPDNLTLSSDGAVLGVDEIRAISEFIHQSASQGNNKTVIIPGAERMSDAAANALLKTLEEPNPHRYLFLLSQQPGALPATILSRCAKMAVTVAEFDAVTDWLHKNAKEALAYPWANHFLSQPLLLKDWQQNQQLAEIEQLVEMANQIQVTYNFKNLIDILTRKPEYIAIFTLFVGVYLQSHLKTGLSSQHYDRCVAALFEFNRNVRQISGINLGLAVSQLMYSLQQELK